MVWTYALLAAGLALAPMAAEAQSYRCVGADGKKYYGSTIPPECRGLLVEQLNSQGQVTQRLDPQGDEKQRLAKEAEAAKKREEDGIAKEASRRNRALLATYTSEKEIDEARRRTLTENEKAIKEVELRIEAIKKRQAAYSKEMEFYQDGAASKQAADKKGKPGVPPPSAKPPPKLLDDIKTAEVDLQAQENLLGTKLKEVEGINAKYDEDKRRYLELTGKNASERGKALGMEKGVTVSSNPGSSVDQRREETAAQRRALADRRELERLDYEREAERRRSQAQQRQLQQR
jgi:hypothetical protein